MITDLDKQVIEFLTIVRIANSRQIQKAVYSKYKGERYGQYCLKILAEKKKEVNRFKSSSNIDSSWLYYLEKRPKQIDHALKITDVYLELGMPKLFEIQKQRDHIIPDIYTEVEIDKYICSFFIEIHQFNGFNFQKYIDDYEAKKRPQYYPDVLIVSDKPLEVPKSEVKFIPVKWDLSNLWKVIK